MAEDAAFCSHQAWSERISSILVSTILTHLGSVGNFNLKTDIYFSLKFKVQSLFDKP